MFWAGRLLVVDVDRVVVVSVSLEPATVDVTEVLDVVDTGGLATVAVKVVMAVEVVIEVEVDDVVVVGEFVWRQVAVSPATTV